MRMTAFLLFLVVGRCHGITLHINITTPDGQPVAGAVAYLLPSKPVESDKVPRDTMDQVNQQFNPHILTVQKGTLVDFPNSDSIKHHVYSFSPAKQFELQLYKGTDTEPLPFDTVGLVELGCNVHDWMLGYILVVDTPYFTQANQQGLASIDLPADQYRLKIWHPRIQDQAQSLEKSLDLQQDTKFEIVLTSDLLPGHDEYEDNDEFSDYE